MSDNPKESREQQNHLGTLLGGFSAAMIAIPTYLNPLLAPLLGNEMPWLLLFELIFLLLCYYWIIKLASPQRAKAFFFTRRTPSPALPTAIGQNT